MSVELLVRFETTRPRAEQRQLTMNDIACDAVAMAEFDDTLMPRLVDAYERGTLVPFVGAGISRPQCSLWPEFVANLENEASIPAVRPLGENVPTSSLVQRAGRAVRKLRQDAAMAPSARNASTDRLAEAVKRALWSQDRREPDGIPPTAKALAQIWWPLVITTNYDDWFLGAWNDAFAHTKHDRQVIERMEVCGRGSSDCERVLNSLRAPDNPLLWAIQGFIGGLAQPTADYGLPQWKRDELRSQLIVGHSEYRREAFRAAGFRRAFSEVFRSRSFLFVGSGLSEGYFDNLFDEVLELQGTLPHMHYALIKRGGMDRRFLRERFQIEAIEYDDHDSDPPAWLRRFHGFIARRPSRSISWGVRVRPTGTATDAGPDLRIVRNPLPKPRDGECLVLSAGMSEDERPLFSHQGIQAAKRHFTSLTEYDYETVGDPRVFRFDGLPVFAAVARDLRLSGRDARDARVVSDVVGATLDATTAAGFSDVHMMLLAAGQRRVFAPYISLVQMVRGYARWKHARADDLCRLTINVLDPGSLHLLAAGRLDLTEILALDRVRFWVEIWRTPSDIQRWLRFCAPNDTLETVLSEYDLPSSGWEAQIMPRPNKHAGPMTSSETLLPQATVASIGLIPGSTLRILPPGLGN